MLTNFIAQMRIEHGKEYSESVKAEMILKMLKSIVGNYIHRKGYPTK